MPEPVILTYSFDVIIDFETKLCIRLLAAKIKVFYGTSQNLLSHFLSSCGPVSLYLRCFDVSYNCCNFMVYLCE